MTFPSNVRVKSSNGLSTKNAWALFVQRRWPGVGGVKAAMAEWDLTEWEARTLFDATSSISTQDKIIDHKRGGFGLGLLVLQIRTQTAVTSFIEERRRHEREEFERIDKGLRQMAADLPRLVDLGSDLAP